MIFTISPLRSLSIAISIVLFSILYSRYCFEKSLLSNTSSSIMAGIGVGISSGIFLYFGVSNGDSLISIIVGLISAFVIGLTFFVMNQRLKK